MNPVNKYDIPGIEDVLSRYERLSVNTNSGAGIFFRWQLMVGESLVDNSKLSNYLVNPNGNFNVDGDGKETTDFNLKDVLHPKNESPGSYSLKLYTHATPKGLFPTRALEFYIKTISPKKCKLIGFEGNKITHKVNYITKGTRYTIPCWYKYESKF